MATQPVHKNISVPARATVGPAMRSRISPIALSQFLVRVTPQVPQNLPLINTQTGNLFHDRSNGNLRWYLPTYVLPDSDPLFGFAASRTGVDNSGNPFNKGRITLSLNKTLPSDVEAFKSANPALALQEIKLTDLVATLTTSSLDSSTGQTRQNSYPGTVKIAASGDLQLTFDNILGSGVIILFENLRKGGAVVLLSGKYEAWRPIEVNSAPAPSPVPPHPTPPPPVLSAKASVPTTVAHSTTAHSAAAAHSAVTHAIVAHPFLAHAAVVQPFPVATVAPHPNTTLQFQPEIHAIVVPLQLGRSYAADRYGMRFTISEDSSTRPIIDVNDLKNFNVRQSEFRELKTLGDIGIRYPSLSRMYIGVLSKAIVVVPACYAIVCSSRGISAVCEALLDSGASGMTKCKFEFAFTIAPNVSPIDFLQLSQEISSNPELKGYTLKLPDFLKEDSSPTLSTTFQSSARYSGSSDPHRFTLMVEIRDQAQDSPAVASANLFIKQLCSGKQPFLFATLRLKLDDYYSDPVETGAVLNFHNLSETDDLALVTEDSQTLTFKNQSPVDLAITRCALYTGNTMNLLPVNQTAKPGELLTVSLPPGQEKPEVFVDREIAVQGDISKSDIAKFLSFQTQDVQSTQFAFGVNAAGVDFDTCGIDKLEVQVTVPAVPDLNLPSFSLVKLRPVDGTVALIPLQNAVSALQSVVLFTIHPKDPNKPITKFSVQHEFTDAPILILQTADLPMADLTAAGADVPSTIPVEKTGGVQ